MRQTLRVAGGTLIATSLGFIAVFSYLAEHFGYPEVLEGTADHVLPALIAAGAPLRGVWTVYAALPTGVAIAAICVFPTFRRTGETTARLGLLSAIVASCAMSAGLARWPTVNHVLGRAFVAAGPAERRTLATLFDACNLYLGTVTGEFIGEFTLSLWFLTVGIAILRTGAMPRALGYAGALTALSMTVGAFRNISSLVAPIGELNNVLLPAWMIALGIGLCMAKTPLAISKRAPAEREIFRSGTPTGPDFEVDPSAHTDGQIGRAGSSSRHRYER